MNPITLNDGTIISLNFVRMLIPYTDGTYRIYWSDGESFDLIGANATIMTNYLTAHNVTIKRTIDPPIAPKIGATP